MFAILGQGLNFGTARRERLADSNMAKVTIKRSRISRKKKTDEVHKHKNLPGYRLMEHKYHILGWLPYALSIFALVSSTIVHHFNLPGFFYTHIVCAAYGLYGLAWSDVFQMGRYVLLLSA